MAFRWRIRHKLLLGLALVVGVIVLLLTGTLYGLASFRGTIRSIDRKHVELNAATAMRTAVDELRISIGDNDSLVRYQEKIEAARHDLQAYQHQLEYTLAVGRDPERGSEEAGYVEVLTQYLNELGSTARAVFARGGADANMVAQPPSPLATRPSPSWSLACRAQPMTWCR